MRGGRRNLILTVVLGVLAASGATTIAVAVAAQKDAPQPPLSAAGSLGPSAAYAGIPAPRSSRDPVPSIVGPVLPSSKPVAIDIPAIKVHSALQYLGLTAQHTLQVPAPGPHYNEAAWYKYSSTPGSAGPAVISGHVDSAAQGPSVFFNLGDLRPGDEVLVTRADGVVAVFTVDGVRRYSKDRFPTLLVYGDTDHAALRLITCGGPFDNAAGQYVDNIVVFASLGGSRASRAPRHS
jgi:hypothetical protein